MRPTVRTRRQGQVPVVRHQPKTTFHRGRGRLPEAVFLRQFREELVPGRRPLGVLLHHLLEKRRHILVPGVAGVAHILAGVVAALECVIRHRDKIVNDIADTGFPVAIAITPSLRTTDTERDSCTRPYPSQSPQDLSAVTTIQFAEAHGAGPPDERR